jgi:NhaB family Na+:H+ antiporter
MITTLSRAFVDNFLGHSADWYKQSIVAFLIINPIVFAISPFLPRAGC